jgi:hypothetical protein
VSAAGSTRGQQDPSRAAEVRRPRGGATRAILLAVPPQTESQRGARGQLLIPRSKVRSLHGPFANLPAKRRFLGRPLARHWAPKNRLGVNGWRGADQARAPKWETSRPLVCGGADACLAYARRSAPRALLTVAPKGVPPPQRGCFRDRGAPRRSRARVTSCSRRRSARASTASTSRGAASRRP